MPAPVDLARVARSVRPPSALVGVSAVLVLGLLSAVLLTGGRPLALDRALAPDAPAADGARSAWRVLSQLGGGPVLYTLLAVLAVVRWRRHPGRHRLWAPLPLLALAVAQVLEGVLFVTLARPAPPDGGPEPGSFSSGHAAAATVGWGLVLYGVLGERAWTGGAPRAHLDAPSALVLPGAVAAGLAVGVSRLALGAHWATDVLAAVGFGVLVLAATLRADRTLSAREPVPSTSHPVTPLGGVLRSRWWWGVTGAAALVPLVPLLLVPGDRRLPDLLVYQGTGGVVGAGGDAYGFRTPANLPFTYPPFAALLSEPLSRIPVGLGQLLWTAGTLAALVPLARVVLAPVVARVGLPLTLAALLVSSPVRSHLRFGQVGVFLVLMVGADLLRSDRRTDLGLGLATAVKLTPAVFLPWLALTRAWSRLCATLAWVLSLTVLGLLLLWRSSVDYLGSAASDTTRFGNNAIPGNQSVRGMLLRSGLAPDLVAPAWLAAGVVLVVAGTWGAYVLEQRHQRLAAVATLAAVSVAVSPISWVHHLVWLGFGVSALLQAGRPRLALGWFLVLLPGLPALGVRLLRSADSPAPLAHLVIDAQGLTAVAAVVVLPLVCRSPGDAGRRPVFRGRTVSTGPGLAPDTASG